MPVDIIIHQAKALGIRLYVESGKLRYIVKANQFPAHLKETIKANKTAIIDYLLSEQSNQHYVIKPVAKRKLVPLSFAQQRMLFIDRMYQGSAHYNMLSTVHFDGNIDMTHIKASFRALIERHSILRTRYTDIRGQWYQHTVSAEMQESVNEYDLTQQTPAEQAQRFVAESNYVFDLQQENPIRISLFKTSASRYTVFFNVHHIACDGVSMVVLVREFQSFYQARLTQQVGELPAPVVAYSDFCIWQQQHFDDGGFDNSLAFWKNHLTGAPLVHQLPLQNTRPLTQRFKGRSLNIVITGQRLVKLRQFNQSRQSTMYMILQTVFALLVCRFSDSEDILIGTPVAGRGYAELENVVGLFLNNIVIRTQLQAIDTFDSLLARNKETILQAYEHQDVPFDLVVEQVNPIRDSGIVPVFQILFNLIKQNTTLAIGDGVITKTADEQVTVKSDLELVAVEKADRIELSWVYDVDLFSAKFIATMSSSFVLLLDGIMEQPELNVYDFALISAQAQAADETVVNLVHNSGQMVMSLLLAASANVPDKTAIVCGDWQISHQALLNKIDSFAVQLQAQGVRRGDRIGLYMACEPLTVIAMFAILKLGLTYVPLAINTPAQRLAFMIADAQLKVILVGSTSELSPEHPVGDLALSVADWLNCNLENAQDQLVIDHDPNDIAYIIYTSGTTGKPKGVQISQANLTSFLLAVRDDLNLSSEQVWLSMTNFSFDISMLELLGSLCFGMTLVFPEKDNEQANTPLVNARLNIESILAAINQHQVTIVQCTPSLFSILLANPAFAAVLPTLSTLLLGGEPLGSHIANYWQQHRSKLGHVRLFNMYGPTEATIWSTFAQISPSQPMQEGAVSIGKPLSNSWIRIVDKQMRSVPPGVIGELIIGGTGVSQGYFNQKVLTSEKFVQQAAGRMYKTGDLVRRLDSGELSFVGRRDEQIKIRGHRIELAEIEAALEQCDGIDKATVLIRQSEAGESQLVAFVISHAQHIFGQVPAVNSLLDESLVERALRSWLPDYMIPNVVIYLDKLPVTSNGKVDKSVLRQLKVQCGTSKTLPDTPMEQTLVLFWKDVLKNQSLEIFKETDFFNLGGNSLHLLQLSSMIKDEMALSVPLTLFIDHRSLAKLSLAIQLYSKQTNSEDQFTLVSMDDFSSHKDIEIEI